MVLDEGDMAEDFVLPTHDGKSVQLASYKNQKNVVFTCGSSVTASVLGVAYSLVNNKYMPIVYIGSWSEYGKIE